MPSTDVPAVLHPLAPLAGEEIRAAREIVFASGRAEVPNDALRFAYVGLCDPPKDLVRAFDRGEKVDVDRRVRVVLLQGPVADVTEAIVSVTRGVVDRWEAVRDVRPPLQIEESILVLAALHEHPEWNAALDRRGIVDRSLVQIDPWPAGTFGLPHEESRRITRCLAYLRESPDDNGYARPLEGLLAFVDMGRGEVLEVVDLGVVPFPPKSGSYYPEDNGPLRTDLKPLEITQPEGPSFEVEGNLVRWQKWSLRVGMDPLEGLVLYTVGYEDGGRVRPILYRASVSEMVVPYGHPGPMHCVEERVRRRRVGTGPHGQLAHARLRLPGGDPLLRRRLRRRDGQAAHAANAICMHEEDYGILWKHVDMLSGRTEVRRSRRLVVELHRHRRQLRVRVLLVLLPRRDDPARGQALRDHVDHGGRRTATPGTTPRWWRRAWPRPSTSISSTSGSTSRSTVPTTRCSRSTRRAPARRARRRTRGATSSARRRPCSRRSRRPGATSTRRTAAPGASSTVRLATWSASPRRTSCCRHRRRRCWRTRTRAWGAAGRLRHAQPVGHAVRPRGAAGGGDYPNQHRGGAGLPEWTAQDRPIVDTDIVLWHTFGVTHIPRPEDWPVMPVEYTGFTLVPFGFFDRNPALDVPPSADHCHDG